MIGKRTGTNVVVFLLVSALLVYLGATTLVFKRAGGRNVVIELADAAGLAERNDVTMRGVPVGAVSEVRLTPSGTALVRITLEPGTEVRTGTTVEITRRSPIGDLTIELTPGQGPPLPDYGRIGIEDTVQPPDPEKTIEALAQVLHAVPSEDLSGLITELAIALRGRARDLATLSQATADLPERILEVQSQLESLIENGPKVTGVLADNADTFADDITQTAKLADILRDQRYDLVRLTENGARFLQVANELISTEKPNIACLVRDFGDINSTLAEPRHLADLKSTLELNHYFFDAVYQVVQTGKDGIDWFRVQLLPHQEPPARSYVPRRPPPNVYGGDSCQSRYGRGVGPANQPGPVWLARGSKLYLGR